MFENIGRKLKSIAKIIFWVGLALSVILSVVLLTAGMDRIFDVITTVLITIPSTVAISFLLYGVGEMIDTLHDISAAQGANRSESERVRASVIESLRSHELISKKEYIEITSKDIRTHENPSVYGTVYRDMKKLHADYDRAAISHREYQSARESILKNL